MPTVQNNCVYSHLLVLFILTLNNYYILQIKNCNNFHSNFPYATDLIRKVLIIMIILCLVAHIAAHVQLLRKRCGRGAGVDREVAGLPTVVRCTPCTTKQNLCYGTQKVYYETKNDRYEKVLRNTPDAALVACCHAPQLVTRSANDYSCDFYWHDNIFLKKSRKVRTSINYRIFMLNKLYFTRESSFIKNVGESLMFNLFLFEI